METKGACVLCLATAWLERGGRGPTFSDAPEINIKSSLCSGQAQVLVDASRLHNYRGCPGCHSKLACRLVLVPKFPEMQSPKNVCFLGASWALFLMKHW
jgi:hypothetical protein